MSHKKQGKAADTKPQSSKRNRSAEEDKEAIAAKGAFEKEVEEALDYYFDEGWLEEQSPLAAPYFIGKFLAAELIPDKTSRRGKALKHVIDLAVKDLLSEDNSHGLSQKERGQRQDGGKTVKAFYCERKFQGIDKRAVAVQRELGMSHATFFRNKLRGIHGLANFIQQHVFPPLICEKPAQRNHVGRDSEIKRAFEALQQRHVYALAGPSGIGKSHMGMALADNWNRDHVLWFTFRPGLNDSLISLVFSLGYFLKSQGAETTWIQLVANHGEIKNESVISGLIRYDLKQLESLPLICIDEVGILQPESKEHLKIIRFLEDLFRHKPTLPILLMGHRIPFRLPRVRDCRTLAGLEPIAVDELLTLEGLSTFSEQHKKSLLQLTKGNPALIHLVIALHRTGETIVACLHRIAQDPSAEALLHQILMRSSPTERELLNELAVYEGFAPADVWPSVEAESALATFIRYGLVNEDSSGGVVVSPFIRGFILDRMLADTKTQCHRKAAQAREKRGEFTSAAGHYAQAGVYALALRIWAVHREAEMSKGHAGMALTMFRIIQQSRLSDPNDQKLYSRLFAELLVASGESQEAIEMLKQTHWPPDHPLTPSARILLGDALEMQNQIEQSLAAYDEAIDSLHSHLQAQKIIAHRHRGFVVGVRNGNLPHARNDAALALLEAENFMGNLEEKVGRYVQAQEHYGRAMQITEGLSNNLYALHDCHANLGLLAWRQERMEESFLHLHKALAYSTQLHWLTGMLVDKIYLSGAHIIARQYQLALDVAEDGLQQALPTGLSYYIAGLYTNAGEAHYYLGHLDKATDYASKAIRLEEENHLPSAYIVLSMAQRAQGAFMAADQTLTLAIEISSQTEDKYALAAAWRELGEVRVCQQRSADARNALTQSMALFRELFNEPMVQEIESRLSKL